MPQNLRSSHGQQPQGPCTACTSALYSTSCIPAPDQMDARRLSFYVSMHRTRALSRWRQRICEAIEVPCSTYHCHTLLVGVIRQTDFACVTRYMCREWPGHAVSLVPACSDLTDHLDDGCHNSMLSNMR